MIQLFRYIKEENNNFLKSVENIGEDFNLNILDLYSVYKKTFSHLKQKNLNGKNSASDKHSSEKQRKTIQHNFYDSSDIKWSGKPLIERFKAIFNKEERRDLTALLFKEEKEAEDDDFEYYSRREINLAIEPRLNGIHDISTEEKLKELEFHNRETFLKQELALKSREMVKAMKFNLKNFFLRKF